MRALVIFGLLIFLLSMPVLAQTKTPDQQQPQRFDGAGTSSWKSPDGRPLPVFIDITLRGFQPAGPKAAADEILKSVSEEGSELGSVIETFVNIYEVEAPVIKGVTAYTGYTLVIVYPEKGTIGEGEFKNPVTFTPGALTNVKQVVSKFGEPTNKQIWSENLTRLIGLDGLVYWWGEVGVSAFKDGKITHVLRRRSVKKT